MTPDQPADAETNPVIEHERQLVEYLAGGCRPKAEWRIGTEHEKFGFRLEDLKPLPYEGEQGIRAVLEGLAHRFGWEPVVEEGLPVALKMDGCSITLEPGGQLELSGEQLDNVHQTCDEVHEHLRQVKLVSEDLEIGFLGMGFQPKWRREEMPRMPKTRYRIMRDYMTRVGNLGHDMMLRTCTVQVNLDFSSEADMVRKFRVGLALQPVATALFANSPFIDGKPNGFMSYRSHVWTDTDPDRCGILPFVFEPGMGFERYTDWMLDVPMYFVRRDGRYIDCAGRSFRDFMDGRLPELPGERPRLDDWEDHLTTAFPEVRLKRYLEMRGADGGPWGNLCALPALWAGLLYDSDALEACEALIEDWTPDDHRMLRRDVPREGLLTPFRGAPLKDLARQVLDIAAGGLSRRERCNHKGQCEQRFLDLLIEEVERGQCPAQRKLNAFHGRWKETVDPVFSEEAY
jgi:glutamate--cysteine ligase